MTTKYIKSPLNYVGGKYKLLPQIIPLLPEEIDTFVDLFCGGLNIGVNVNANTIIANDISKEVISFYQGLEKEGTKNALEKVKSRIEQFELSKTNEEGFKKIREYYNQENRDWDVFYALLTNAFNYQIRFSKKGDFNTSFGKNRSSFNPNLEKNFIEFSNRIEEKNFIFSTLNFEDFDINNLTKNDFVYIDPPYLISTAPYNEQGGWGVNNELKLLEFCDTLNEKGIRFAISNVFEHKGFENTYLKDWSKKYNSHYLDFHYKNSSYQGKKLDEKTIEVLITNY